LLPLVVRAKIVVVEIVYAGRGLSLHNQLRPVVLQERKADIPEDNIPCRDLLLSYDSYSQTYFKYLVSKYN
jgi:hypothetical protein